MVNLLAFIFKIVEYLTLRLMFQNKGEQNLNNFHIKKYALHLRIAEKCFYDNFYFVYLFKAFKNCHAS